MNKGQRSKSKDRSPKDQVNRDFGLWTLGFGLPALVFGLWSWALVFGLVFGLWSSGFGLWAGLRALVVGLWSSGFGLRSLVVFGLRSLVFGIWALAFGHLWKSKLKYRSGHYNRHFPNLNTYFDSERHLGCDC